MQRAEIFVLRNHYLQVLGLAPLFAHNSFLRQSTRIDDHEVCTYI